MPTQIDGVSWPVKQNASFALETDPCQFQSGMLEQCAQDVIYQVYIKMGVISIGRCQRFRLHLD